MNAPSTDAPRFSELGLSEPVLQALAAIGYESPSPIQAAAIPVLLAGQDLLGQAQTGTGKTAAFALPMLSQLDLQQREPQALVMVPTRELAIQVAEAFQKYAAHLPGFHVLPIYGGQSYTPQLNALRRGAHVIVGTPGRIMDHLERGSLKFDGVRFVVLDEADEMLQMGFVDAIESILQQVPEERQVALFSATVAPAIRRIAQRHLREPREITIKTKTTTAANIRQRCWLVSGLHKLDALTRILEVETFDAMLVFARTKQMTMELAERLSARGFAAAALNGDIQQSQRERTVMQLKNGQIDILVATDVAARGLDVERVSHVVNFDVPYDTESYVHRIGRTGRAGRNGEAILFIAPRERNMLRLIERATRQPIEPMNLPSVEDVNAVRVKKFKERLTEALGAEEIGNYRRIVEEYVQENGAELADVAAALVSLAQGKAGLLLKGQDRRERQTAFAQEHAARLSQEWQEEAGAESGEGGNERLKPPPGKRGRFEPQDTYCLQVGARHGVQAGHIVGLLANEADLPGSQINGIDIHDDHSYVRLPKGMPDELLHHLQKLKLKGQELRLTRVARPQRDGEERDFKNDRPPAHRAHAAEGERPRRHAGPPPHARKPRFGAGRPGGPRGAGHPGRHK
ncbi:MAG: DEAD/DEAH box helicase [Steroidobacteraceae bacterium]